MSSASSSAEILYLFSMKGLKKTSSLLVCVWTSSSDVWLVETLVKRKQHSIAEGCNFLILTVSAPQDR